MKNIINVFLVVLCLLLSACKKENACIERKIKSIKSEKVWNPPAEIWQYKYNGQTVYYIPPRCCDIASVLLDEHCSIICSPDASISLHARSISFIHPINLQPTTITANPPNDKLWNYFVEIAL